jgi:23S rRNA (adenine2503-C2)-methyltransferase
MTRDELRTFLSGLGEKPYRADQIFGWLHRKGAASFAEMTDVSKSLREKLAEMSADADERPGASDAGHSGDGSFCATIETSGDGSEISHAVPFELMTLGMDRVQVSSDDTRKYLFRTADNQLIESVVMKYHFGNTVCVSSQAGCAMGCVFCASGLSGLARNLSPAEMEDQLLLAEKDFGERISRIVVMGTGEPFANYENLMAFLTNVTDPAGRGMGRRQITVSTCGLPEGMHRFKDDLPQANLAISLHAPNDGLRRRIMPKAAAAMGVGDIVGFSRGYTEQTGRKITFEYALIAGWNDSPKEAAQLIPLLKGFNCLVNLIPLNPVRETGLRATSREDAIAFAHTLEAGGLNATVRREVGVDIDAACGQLRMKSAAEKP